jgi:hypothetical protein
MYLTVELVLKSYMPKHLEPGMWFINKINNGTLKEHTEVWALDRVPNEPFDEFITKHGAPVEPYLIYEDEDIFGVMAEPHEIGWWDEGPDKDDLRDLELKDVNFILNEWDGLVDVKIDEWDYAHEDELNPVLYGDDDSSVQKVILCIPGMYDEEEELVDDDDDDDNDPHWDDMDDDTWKEI